VEKGRLLVLVRRRSDKRGVDVAEGLRRHTDGAAVTLARQERANMSSRSGELVEVEREEARGLSIR
jgi:hypothetical protein